MEFLAAGSLFYPGPTLNVVVLCGVTHSCSLSLSCSLFLSATVSFKINKGIFKKKYIFALLQRLVKECAVICYKLKSKVYICAAGI